LKKELFVEEDTIPGILEEYCELRQEIRIFLTRREQSKNLAFMIAFAVIGLDLSKIVTIGDWLYPLSATVIYFIWFDELCRIRNIFRIASYIEVFIESKIPGLKWETVSGRNVQKLWMRRIFSNAEFPLMLVVFTWLSWARFADKYPIAALVGAISSTSMIIFLGIVSLKIARNGRSFERANWISLRDNN
jgi:hypothetical protein